ncbi:MAG: glyceraldehyde 3-phosphate dehydrogenase NAD-binding domain-containing protein [Paracoccaceae bacterium]|nr:glyceraldehyde 3-phosphate dehydrogenase NAD-binding domain-containing protein [Paracoccaceae bacterium]
MARPLRIAINGFGRIGRSVLRILMQDRLETGIEVVCINDIAPVETCAYLFEYDSVFGVFRGDVSHDADHLIFDDTRVRFHRTPDLSTVDLAGVDLVLECTGKAQARDWAMRGLDAGAKRVMITGPSDAADVTVVLGANDAVLGDQTIVSNASCTTNALAPLLARLDERFDLRAAHMTTIHCYTGSQPMVDGPRGDMARSRAGALSMVPTTTSASRMVGVILPDMADRLTAASVRVPTASVSAIDVVARFDQTPDAGSLQAWVAEQSDTIIGHTDRPLVSTDLRGRPESLIVAQPEAMVGGDGQVRIFGWYDNEWGYANRVIDLALRMT